MTSTSAGRASPSLGAVLAPVHRRWAGQVRSVLAPATDTKASFWSRWGVARFLGDQFEARARLEYTLADAVRPLIAPEAAARLSAARGQLERTREKLMEIGRRRGLPTLTAGLTERFLEDVVRWWAELEVATERLDADRLPPNAVRLLERMQAADRLSR